MKKIIFVCLGNICRSPMAEFVMKSLTDNYHIESRATSSWEHGNPIHPGTQHILKHYQIPYDVHKFSQQLCKQDFDTYDYIIGMDAQNVRDIQQMAPHTYIAKIAAFDEESVPDPYYTGDFEDTYTRVQIGCHKWLERLEKSI